MSDNPSSRTWRAIRAALIIAGAQVCGCLLLILAYKQEMIDRETLMRGGMVVCGLGLAAIGNIMPKMMDGSPPQTLALATLKQSTYRVGGWAMSLAGLVFASLWVFAPFDVAATGCVVALGAGIAVMFGYKAWRVFAHHRSSAS